MSAIHVLETNGGSYRVALHIAVPFGNNAAGTPWSTALLNSGHGGTTVLKSGDGTAGTIAAAELTAVQAATVLEVIATFNPSQTFEGASAAAQKAEIDAFLAQQTTLAVGAGSALSLLLNRYGLNLT